MFKNILWPWIATVFIATLPFLALMAIGGWWLWHEQMLLQWLSVSVTCTGIVWIMSRLLNKHQKKQFSGNPSSPQTPLSQTDQVAWNAVAELTLQIQQNKHNNLDQLENWLKIGRQVLGVVAKHYRPNTKNMELDIPATDLLRIVEHVSHDMHRQLLVNLPLSHVITLADGLNFHRWLEHLGDAKTALRLGRMIMNPLSGVLNEAKSYAQDKAVDLTMPHLQSWLLEMYIQKIGEYAILLYSGRMSVASEKVESLSVQSRQDRQQAKIDQEHLDLEPLRILVAGQTNAGKSSLINTLFDKPRAATDVVSCTAELMPYQLEREGQLSGLIFDTPGYGEQISWLGNNRKELDKIDLVLLVCSANNAARAADRRFLDAFEQHFQAQPHRKIPPIVLVVTHIDELRPIREWQPPYNIEAPNCIKAKNIRNAIEAIQNDLALPSNTAIVPVSLGTNEGLGIYNVDSLILAMGQQMDEAYHARLLRCLKDAQGREKWPQLWRQFASSGLWLLRKAGDSLP